MRERVLRSLEKRRVQRAPLTRAHRRGPTLLLSQPHRGRPVVKVWLSEVQGAIWNRLDEPLSIGELLDPFAPDLETRWEVLLALCDLERKGFLTIPGAAPSPRSLAWPNWAAS